MKEKFQGDPINNDCKKLFADILTIFTKSLSGPDSNKVVSILEIYLPDDNLILHRSNELSRCRMGSQRQ